MCPQPWLIGVKGRTSDDVEFQKSSEMLEMIESDGRPYKTKWEFYQCRGRDSISFLWHARVNDAIEPRLTLDISCAHT